MFAFLQLKCRTHVEKYLSILRFSYYENYEACCWKLYDKSESSMTASGWVKANCFILFCAINFQTITNLLRNYDVFIHHIHCKTWTILFINRINPNLKGKWLEEIQKSHRIERFCRDVSKIDQQSIYDKFD